MAKGSTMIIPTDLTQREPPRKRTNRRQIGLRILGVFTGLSIVGLLACWRLLQEDPMVARPVVALPSPNAYDFYLAADKANARTLDTIMQNPAFWKWPEGEQALKQIEAAIQKDAPALPLLHRGFAYEYRNPPYNPNALHPEWAAFRSLARLVAMQSEVRAARGNWGGAADSALDAIRLGEDIPHGGPLNAGLVGIACEAIGERPMWATVDHLNAAQSRAAIKRLQAILARHATYSEVMQEEKWDGQASLRAMFRTQTPKSAMGLTNDYLSFNGKNLATLQRYRMVLYLLLGKKVIIRNYMTYMDQLSASGRQSYGLHLPLPPTPSDPLNQETAPIFAKARWNFVQVETQNNLLLVALALHAFRLENGHPPASLAELIPPYLPKLPDDPCARQGTFKYHLQGAGYVLYSIGPDGKDDGGTPIPRFASAP